MTTYSCVAGLLGEAVADEMRLAELGNRARTRRACWFLKQWAEHPNHTFSEMGKTSAGRQGIYKFLESEFVGYDALVEAHALQTYGRIEALGCAVAVHDTTEFEPPTDCEGMGRLRGKAGGHAHRGMLTHVSFAVAEDSRAPLGTLAMRVWTRADEPPRTRNAKGKKLNGSACAKLTDRESDRWWDAVEEVGGRVDRNQVVHTMDREADAYPLLAKMVGAGHQFVVRTARDRVVCAEDTVGEHSRLSAVMSAAPVMVTREVVLSNRNKSNIPGVKETFGERKQRRVELAIRSSRITLRRPNYLGDEYPEWLPVNIVDIEEISPPDGADPVKWTLVTGLPIDTVMDVERIVDIYRTRWIIEELFKALKTGCGLGKRMLESFETMTNAIAMALPVAWHLLRLRYLAHTAPDAPATEVLTPSQIQILQQQSRLPARTPSAKDALFAVASLGGYAPNKGRRPGWQVLGRGFATLLRLEEGWLAAIAFVRQTKPKKLDYS
jgi:hypothetical protein